MDIMAQPNWLSLLDQSAKQSLSRNMKGVSAGSDEVLISPVMEDVPDEQLFQDLWDILGKVDVTPTLKQIEEEQQSKCGPRSLAQPWSVRRSTLVEYFNHPESSPILAKEGGYLRPISLEQAVGRLIGSSSAGLPSMQKKRLIRDSVIGRFETEVGVYPCVLFTRTQEQMKTRNIWGFPVSDTLNEQMFFAPWLEIEKRFDFRAALHDPNFVDAAITRLLNKAMNVKSSVVYCVDFSGYDASVSPSHIAAAMEDIKAHFQAAYHDEFDQIIHRMIHIPVWTPEGEISGHHGVPSGSVFTNTVDSWVQHMTAESLDNQIQGDDGVHLLLGSHVEDFERRFESEGFKINPEKARKFSGKDREAVYLQRYYSPHYRSAALEFGGVYPIFRAANRIKYLERWTNVDDEGIAGRDYFSLRTIGILENAKHHPGFSDFVRYIRSNDRYGLSFSMQGMEQYARNEEAKAKGGGQFGSYSSRGLLDFDTVRVLLEDGMTITQRGVL